MKPRVTVVVPTCGRPMLLQCLASIARLAYPKNLIEVVIVDDGSTSDVCNSIQSTISSVQIIKQPWCGPATARNRGLESATGDLVCFTDDDCVVDENWLTEFARTMQDSSIAGVGGRVRATDRDVISQYMDHIHALDPSLLPSGEPWYLVTANSCFRRSALLEVGGFDTDFKLGAAEDVDLCLRLQAQGKRLKFQPSCLVSHSFENTLTSFISRFHRYGVGTRFLFEKHKVWREWPPDAAEWLWTMLQGYDDDGRAFLEVQDINNRFWFSFLGRLEIIMFLIGYCRLSQGADLDRLRGRASNGYFASGVEPWGHRKLGALRVLSSLLLDEENLPPDSAEEIEGFSWAYDFHHSAKKKKDQRLWLATINSLLDLDDLLSMTGRQMDHVASVPDESLDDETRNFWLALHAQQETAFGNRSASVLRVLEGGLRCTDFSEVQSVCDRYSLEVRRFFAWRERLIRDSARVVERLDSDLKTQVIQLMKDAQAASAVDGHPPRIR